ncbi:MAG: hypothetical protein HY399_00355 [Elusimicrobia bacterium]|nr:hypothetical protein [Elusimicrobiota bacterium]
MSESKKKSTSTAPEERSVYQMILEQVSGKYQLVPLVSQWATELKKSEEHRNLPWNQILEIAIRDVLTGKVTSKNIKGLSRNGTNEKEDSGEDKKKKSS